MVDFYLLDSKDLNDSLFYDAKKFVYRYDKLDTS